MKEARQRKKQIPYEIAYMWNLNKNGANELSYKTEIESQMQRKNLRLLRGKKGEGINWEIGIDRYTPLYIKQITNKE